MTTQDHEAPTDSYEEPQAVRQETAPTREQVEPAVSGEQREATAQPSASSPGAQAPTAAVERPSTEREPSQDDLLFAQNDLAELRSRWAAVQAAFVDDPKDCVQKADVLVSDLVEQLTSGFSTARSRLEEQWGRGEEVSTEDLRVALMHYREFFERLLAV